MCSSGGRGRQLVLAVLVLCVALPHGPIKLAAAQSDDWKDQVFCFWCKMFNSRAAGCNVSGAAQRLVCDYTATRSRHNADPQKYILPILRAGPNNQVWDVHSACKRAHLRHSPLAHLVAAYHELTLWAWITVCCMCLLPRLLVVTCTCSYDTCGSCWRWPSS
jgi:hypothetical protein